LGFGQEAKNRRPRPDNGLLDHRRKRRKKRRKRRGRRRREGEEKEKKN
jgi:hypothetical protein